MELVLKMLNKKRWIKIVEQHVYLVRSIMKKSIRNISFYLNIAVIDPLKAFQSMSRLPIYLADYFELKRQQPVSDTQFKFGWIFPCLGDGNVTGGSAKGHYFHQDLLVASRIFAKQPERHIDLGSRVDGFVAHVASFRQIAVVDIRPLTSHIIRNVEFLQTDLMNEPPVELVASCDSLSCLHALEHFGLGRYGDPVCWDGYRVGLDNLLTILKPGGKFYFSVPIGKQRIEFNAHRVFSLAYLLEMISGRLKVDDFFVR